MLDCRHMTSGGLCRHADGPLTCRLYGCPVFESWVANNIWSFVEASRRLCAVVAHDLHHAALSAEVASTEETRALLNRLRDMKPLPMLFPGEFILEECDRPGLCWEPERGE